MVTKLKGKQFKLKFNNASNILCTSITKNLFFILIDCNYQFLELINHNYRKISHQGDHTKTLKEIIKFR